MPIRSSHRAAAPFAALSIAALMIGALPARAAPAEPTYAVSGKIAGPDGGWDYVSFDPAHRRLYVSRGDGVLALDVDTGVVTPHLADGKRTHETLVLAGGDTLLVTNGASGTALVINVADGKQIGEIPTGPAPDAAALETGTNLAVVVSAVGVATVIDPTSKAVVASIPVGGKLEFLAGDGHGHMFVNVESKNEIAVLDLKTRSVTARYKLDGCESPGGLAYDPKAGVLIAACDNGVAKVVAARTGAVVATLKIGKGPDAVIFDPVRGLAFIPCGGDGVLDVIKVGNGRDALLIQVANTERGARTGMVDPKTGALYLPAATYGPPPPAGGALLFERGYIWKAEAGGDILCEVVAYRGASRYDAGVRLSRVIRKPGR